MTLKARHQKANKTLNRLAQKVINGGNARRDIEPLAKKHGISPQTVLNYFYGMGSDGYLKEVLIEDLKSM